MKEKLKPLQGEIFTNKATGIQARVSGKTKGKSVNTQMSVANLKHFGIDAEQARKIHYTAASRINELFENADDAFFEEAYKNDASREGAYHLFNTVDIEGMGVFDVNITAVSLVKTKDNILYNLELTIENPATLGGASRNDRLSTPFTDGVLKRNLSSYRSFVEKEKMSLKKRHLNEGTFMKAPNGEDTALSEDKWLTVRTKSFKNWFGDWEKDPANSSKVVDENGEPQVVYHGATSDFSIFESKKIGSATDSGIWGRGFYFASMPTSYCDRQMPVFLNIKKPFDISAFETPKQISDYLGVYQGNFREKENRNVKVAFNQNSSVIGVITSGIMEKGHDGIFANLTDVWTDYVAFESSQIKSAIGNRGTFDGNNPDISFAISQDEQKAWEKEVDSFLIKKESKESIKVSHASDLLKTLGLIDADVFIDARILTKINKEHFVSLEEIKKIPQGLSDPIAVFRSKKPNSLVVITDLQARTKTSPEKQNVMISLSYDAKVKKISVNKITSAYARDNISDYQQWVKDNLLIYLDTKKATNWLESARLSLPLEPTTNSDLNANILTKEELVNSKDSPQIDFSLNGARNPYGLNFAKWEASRSAAVRDYWNLVRRRVNTEYESLTAALGGRDKTLGKKGLAAKLGKARGIMRVAINALPIKKQERFIKDVEAFATSSNAPMEDIVMFRDETEKNGYRLEHLPESEFEREEKGAVNIESMTDIVGKLQLLEDAGFTAIHMLEEKTEKPYYINSIASGERQFFSSMQEAMEGLAVEWEQSEQYFNDELRLALNEETGAWLDKQLPEGANARFDYQQEKAMTAADFAAQGARMEKAINARMAIAMEAEGMATGLSPKEVRVMGTNLSRVVKDMNLETIQTLYKGASPLTVFEERAEGLYDYFVHSGYFTQEQALAWLLQLEKQTDKRFIFYDNNKPIEEQYLNIKEGWSNAATSYAMGKLDDARIPAALRRWFRAIIQSVSELFKKDGFLQKAMKGNALNKLEKSGKMDAEFRQYLAESVGMNWTKEEQAYIEKAQEEVLAEAAGVSLSIGQNKSPESIHTQWKESLEEYLSGRNPKKDRDITVCPTPAVLRMLGAKAHDLVITPGVINKVMQDKHAVSREAMEGLSLAIENPIAVFESATSANSLVLLTELKEGENNIVVALLMDAQGVGENTSVKVNRVRSIYGKEGARSLISSPCLYVDTKKARSWVQIARLQLPGRTPFRKGSKGKIHTPEDVVKWKDKSNVSFSVVSMDNTGKSLSAETFITKKDGNPDWFIIPKRAGQKEMPVRLLVGLDKGSHKGYGLNHLVASRVEDDLWEKTSPAKYISDILENASELYEISPGRELLVKGKQPSSWMVLQLDRQEGYYSIITAYPASFRKKPLGRRIPLVEQLYDKRSQRVDRSQRPTNTESGTVRLRRGSVANAALQPPSAGRESATQLPAGSDSVNIKDVICQMNDGSKMNASFAITLPDGMQERENPKFLTRLQAIANSSNERKATALQAIISRIEGELRRQGYNLNGFPLAENSDSAQTRQAKLLKAIRYIDGMLGMLPKKLRGEVYGMSSNSEYLNLREAAMEEAIESEAAFNRHFGKIVSKVNNVLEREAQNYAAESIEALLQRGAPKVGKNKVLMGKLDLENAEVLKKIITAIHEPDESIEPLIAIMDDPDGIHSDEEKKSAKENLSIQNVFGGILDKAISKGGRRTQYKRSSNDMMYALKALQEVVNTGRAKAEALKEDRAVRLANERDAVCNAVGRAEGIDTKSQHKGITHRYKLFLEFLDFGNMLQAVFGRDNKIALEYKYRMGDGKEAAQKDGIVRADRVLGRLLCAQQQ